MRTLHYKVRGHTAEEFMGRWLRRIRGAVGMGFTWAVAWAAVGLVPRWVLGFNPDAPFPIIFGVFGFVSGVTFSALVVLTEGRHRFEQISLSRFALWGAAGGLLLAAGFARLVSLSWGDLLALAPTLALASAGCAAGSLAMARRAARQELSGGEKQKEVGGGG
jgi:hypothetical protein